LQAVPDDFSRKEVARYYSVAMKNYFKQKEQVDAPEILEIRMEDFMKDKIEGLKEIYRFCKMDGFGQALPAFETYLAEHPVAPHETNHVHADTIRFVNQYASDVVTRLGYPLRQAD